jgi:hypothetical protein
MHDLTTSTLTTIELLELAEELARDRHTWLARVEHRDDHRWFERVVANDVFDAWLIGWHTTQGVDLHDHGGSSGALSVLDGELTEVSGRRGAGTALMETTLAVGTTRAFDPAHLHAVVNRTPRPATSIHVYSPPLVTMGFYAPTDSSLVRIGADSHFPTHSDTRPALAAAR